MRIARSAGKLVIFWDLRFVRRLKAQGWHFTQRRPGSSFHLGYVYATVSYWEMGNMLRWVATRWQQLSWNVLNPKWRASLDTFAHMLIPTVLLWRAGQVRNCAPEFRAWQYGWVVNHLACPTSSFIVGCWNGHRPMGTGYGYRWMYFFLRPIDQYADPWFHRRWTVSRSTGEVGSQRASPNVARRCMLGIFTPEKIASIDRICHISWVFHYSIIPPMNLQSSSTILRIVATPVALSGFQPLEAYSCSSTRIMNVVRCVKPHYFTSFVRVQTLNEWLDASPDRWPFGLAATAP